MKREPNYTPKYSLSIYYLKKILSPKEFNNLLRDYVKAKQAEWDTKFKKFLKIK